MIPIHILGGPKSIYPFQSHICINLYNGSNPSPPPTRGNIQQCTTSNSWIASMILTTPNWTQQNVLLGHLFMTSLYYRLAIFTLPWHSPAMKHKKTVVNIFQSKTLVTWRKNWHWFVRLIREFSSDWSTLFIVACKSLRSASRFTRFTCDQCSFIS